MIRLQESLGIHIKKDKIILVSIAKTFKTISFIGIHSILDTKNSREYVTHIADLIKDFLKRKKTNPDFVTLGFSRNMLIQRNITLPNVEDGNIRDMLDFELEHHIPFAKGDVYFDFHVLDKTPQGIELLLIGTRRETLDIYFDIFKKVGLNISSADVSYFANCNLVQFNYPELKNKHIMLVDFGESEIEYSYFSGARLYFSRTRSYEKISDHGKKNSEAGDSPELKRVFNDLIRDINISLKGISIGGDIEEVLLCGEDGSTGFLAELFRKHFNVPVRVVKTFQKVEKSDSAVIERMDDSSALGLALKPFIEDAVGINLLPDHLREKEKKLGLIIFLVLLTVNLGFGVGIPASRVIKEKLYIEKLEKRIASLKPKLAEVEDIKLKIEEKEKLLETFARFKKRNIGMLDILQELSDKIPTDVWLSAFNYNKKGAEITGLAKSASSLISILEKSPIFEKVKFSQPITVKKNKQERFKVTFSLKKTIP